MAFAEQRHVRPQVPVLLRQLPRDLLGAEVGEPGLTAADLLVQLAEASYRGGHDVPSSTPLTYRASRGA